ncbi:serine/threonine-protein kinase RIO1 [Neodiprion fabricii]|uniref:serine/threonine-protein kinase RIO1 n=1 Tax=Neodiprion fabricii TaxID=2872261 RepID=UPI001ED927CD|nr:serine/threonine-protein kinase RIO1 [Neodiprion fabricii]XP_046411884.1 serine/threonine-protein kinase RIO1 [Neodiprion fabricii]
MASLDEGQFSDADEETIEKTKCGKPMIIHELTVTVGQLQIDIEDNTEYDSEDDSYDWDVDARGNYQLKNNSRSNGTANSQMASNKVSNYQPTDKLFRRYSNKINVEKYEGPSLPNHAANLLIESNKRTENERIRTKDKHDRATAEQVMDPRTRMILFKLLNRGIIAEINGCISTGKEANVYHATSKTGIEFAIKIYKTSILVFKDRDKYVSGGFRFRHGYCRHNPRKMVRTWAEKEMRNLLRLSQAGVCAPKPILLRSHVLLMDFIGNDGWPAPKLKDVEINSSKARSLYRECVVMMWRIYNKCKLVHADLSEFNLLYHKGEIVVIDVSQSVEHDHPHAYEFLRKDCTNITEFFKKHGVAVMTMKELFDFITDPNIVEDTMDEYLDALAEQVMLRESEEMDPNNQIEEQVFKQTYIPQRLNEVVNIDKDISEANTGEQNLLRKTVYGLSIDLPKVTTVTSKIISTKSHDDSHTEESGEDESESDSESQNNDESKFVNSARPRDESPDSKKARKKAIKEQQAENRKKKTKKHIKKRKEKIVRKK